MGFPLGYTGPCLPKGRQQGESYLDARHTLIGNAWHVTVISWLLMQLFRPLGLTECVSLESCVLGCYPGRDSQLQGFLARPPLVPVRQTTGVATEAVLTKKLANFVSVKGEDLMIQAPSEGLVKFHRLRASVPSKLWRWRTICGWPWKHAHCHINFLELQAILTCMQWRMGKKKHRRCRFLHLTDSLVCLHTLSRGRSSSRKLRAVLCKINALLLAADVHPLWGYVHTRENPADRPSRRPVRKPWRKRRRI